TRSADGGCVDIITHAGAPLVGVYPSGDRMRATTRVAPACTDSAAHHGARPASGTSSVVPGAPCCAASATQSMLSSRQHAAELASQTDASWPACGDRTAPLIARRLCNSEIGRLSRATPRSGVAAFGGRRPLTAVTTEVAPQTDEPCSADGDRTAPLIARR